MLLTFFLHSMNHRVPSQRKLLSLTGITDEMVLGHQIDAEAVSSFVSNAAIIVAHNANFDRKFAERYWALFESKPWACSATEIDWRRYGFDGSRLAYLLVNAGLFHQAHRAIDDCRALLEVLSRDLQKLNRSAFSILLERARRKTVRIWAESAPFELKDILKSEAIAGVTVPMGGLDLGTSTSTSLLKLQRWSF